MNVMAVRMVEIANRIDPCKHAADVDEKLHLADARSDGRLDRHEGVGRSPAR